jgi:hypothetical protein
MPSDNWTASDPNDPQMIISSDMDIEVDLNSIIILHTEDAAGDDFFAGTEWELEVTVLASEDTHTFHWSATNVQESPNDVGESSDLLHWDSDLDLIITAGGVELDTFNDDDVLPLATETIHADELHDQNIMLEGGGPGAPFWYQIHLALTVSSEDEIS